MASPWSTLGYMSHHFHAEKLTASAACECASQGPRAFGFVDMRPFFQQLEQELSNLHQMLNETKTCTICKESASRLALNRIGCWESFHTGRHQGGNGWSCCDARKLKDTGCQSRYVGTHKFEIGSFPVLDGFINVRDPAFRSKFR